MNKKEKRTIAKILIFTMVTMSLNINILASEDDHFAIYDTVKPCVDGSFDCDSHFEIGVYEDPKDTEFENDLEEAKDDELCQKTVSENKTITIEKNEPIEEEVVAQTADVIPTIYDPRDFGMVTSVKNQGDSTNCTIFAAISTMESYLIRMGYENNNVDLSEIYFATLDKENGSELEEGKTKNLTTTIIDSFLANNKLSVCAIPESIMPTPNMTKHFGNYTINRPNNLTERNDTYVCKEVLYKNLYSQNDVKQLISKYGGISIVISRGGTTKNNINTKHDSTVSNANGWGHEVEVVGWDDKFPASSFQANYSKNGAWLCKNSYGSTSTDSGFFWISYADIEYFEGCSFYELIPANSYVRKITLPQNEFSLYVGQTSDPIVPTSLTPSTVINKNTYIECDSNKIEVNNNRTITALNRKKTYEWETNVGAYVYVYPSDGIDKNARATLKVNILPNEVKCDKTVMIPDRWTSEITGLSTYPVAGREDQIEVTSECLTITANQYTDVIQGVTPYGSISLKARLDEEDNAIPAYVYCTQMRLGDDVTINGSEDYTLTAQFPLSNNLDAFKGKLVVNSSNPSIVSAEADGANIKLTPHKNGKVALTAYVKDKDLTNGNLVSDCIFVTVTGMGGEYSDPGNQYPTEPDPEPVTPVNPQPEPVKPEVTVTCYKGAYYKKVGNEAHLTDTLGTKKTVTVPDKVKIGDKKLKVTEIEKKAFSGDKKVKTVNIGKNVDTIGKKAFYNCPNLKTVKISSKKVTSVGSKALKKIKPGAVVKVPKKMKTKYESILKKKKDAGTRIK